MENQYNADQWKFMDEMCILVDEKDNQVGFDSKKNCTISFIFLFIGHLISQNGSLKCHRAFSVFLFDSNNRLLLQRRSEDKITFPLYWANTCCSHPLNIEGETETVDNIGVKR